MQRHVEPQQEFSVVVLPMAVVVVVVEVVVVVVIVVIAGDLVRSPADTGREES